MKHGVLKHFHPMLGRDLHIPWPPGSPAPSPAPVPYTTFSLLVGTALTSQYSVTAYTDGRGFVMLQGTDIGPLILHAGPPSLTMPIEFALSASKSLFGVANYQVEGKPIAVSLLFVVNMNLNCGTPLPLPFGTVLALATHRVNMTLADICGGIARMGAETLLQWGLGKLGNFVGDRVFKVISRTFGERVFFNALMKYISPNTSFAIAEALALTRHSQWLGQVYRLTGPVVGIFLGGPLGLDAGIVGLSADAVAGKAAPGGNDSATAKAADLADQSGRAVGDYLERKFPDDSGPGDYPLPSDDKGEA